MPPAQGRCYFEGRVDLLLQLTSMLSTYTAPFLYRPGRCLRRPHYPRPKSQLGLLVQTISPSAGTFADRLPCGVDAHVVCLRARHYPLHRREERLDGRTRTALRRKEATHRHVPLARFARPSDSCPGV